MTRLELLKAVVKGIDKIEGLREELFPCDIYEMPEFCQNYANCDDCEREFWHEEIKI